MTPPTQPPEAPTDLPPPPPYEPNDPANDEHHNAPPPAFASRNSTLVAPRGPPAPIEFPTADRPDRPAPSNQPVPKTEYGYPDETAILKQRDAEQNAPTGTHYCSTTTRDNAFTNPYASPAPLPGSTSPVKGGPFSPSQLSQIEPQQDIPSSFNRRSFFRSSVGNLRETLSGSRQSRPRAAPAERTASQMEQFARRLEMQNRSGPSAAEAEKRVMQLRSDAAQASFRAGPRVSTGIFKASCSTDLLFLIDATGSMLSYIEAAKTQVRTIVSDINRTFFNEADVRVAVVAYRDHNDRKPLEFLDFTNDVSEVFKFLNSLIATGGDDVAEDVLGGLDQALKASWKHQTRCIMHIADAPAHGNNLHEMGRHSDHYYGVGTEPHGLQYQTVIKEMMNNKINYIFFRVHTNTDKMSYMFMMIYGMHTTACKLHQENKYALTSAQWLKDQTARNRAEMLRASAKEYMEKKMEDEGGLHFEEVQLGISYSSLRHLVVNSVAASSSRTAVRLSASLSASGGRRNRSSITKSKLGHKTATLSNLDEDEQVDVFEEAREWQSELEIRAVRDNFDSVTLADTIVEADEEEEEEEERPGASAKSKDRNIEFDTGEPQWNKKGWLDQTMHVKAFSPDVIDIAPPTSAVAHTLASSAAVSVPGAGTSILDRMMQSDDNIRISTNELVIHRRTKPFAQGALRLASYARTQESTNPLVVKTFKANGKRLADLAEDMRMQALCKAFALEFNSLVASEEHSLDFIVVTCLQPISSSSEDDECMSLEPMLQNGRYVKYNNNCGSVNDDNNSEVSKAAQAFSHFTFERSQGELLVADLQGIDNVLTDPAIHTRDPHRFVLTDTNLGVDGFKLFFSTHKCNHVCMKLDLKSQAEMFIRNDFVYRTDWPAITYHQAAGTGAGSSTSGSSSKRSKNGPETLVCCSNKLCSKIVRVATARKTAPSFYWCDKCWPQLRLSTVKRVCATPDAYHEFEVSKFFFESQGQLMPQTCADHGGVPSLPVAFEPKSKGLNFFKRRRPGASS
ncbi:hypothetical protein Sste5346_001184 [Sporothrix stenoceras]|uniref:Mhck ef2 kinase domain family protein n=1 Tax=Sporothrix stenoceras TaxID=5173 RepID=A0ABR3ZRG0_9PEZI